MGYYILNFVVEVKVHCSIQVMHLLGFLLEDGEYFKLACVRGGGVELCMPLFDMSNDRRYYKCTMSFSLH